MRRFQNILYVTRGTEDETDSLKQALSLARNNAAALHAVAVCPMLPNKLGEYEAGYETSVADRIRGIPGFVIGNTAENVLREPRCSLLALKPNGFVSPVRAY